MSKQAIDRGHEMYLEAMRAGDASAFAALLTEDATFCPPHEPTRKGKKEVIAWFKEIFSQIKTERVTVDEREVEIADGWAAEKGSFVWVVSPAGGGEAIEDQGRFLAIWRQQSDGSWKAAYNIWNSIKPLL